MKKNVLLLCMLFPGSIFCFQPADSCYDRAVRDVAREEAAAHQARVRARAEALQKRDDENFAALAQLAWHGIVGLCRVVGHPSQISHGWHDGDGEVIGGTVLAGAGIAVVTAALFANLVGLARSDDRR